MTSDADEFWDDVARKLRKKKGLCPLTDEEADAAFDDAPEIPPAADAIESIIESVRSGELTSWEPYPDVGWGDGDPANQIENQAMAVYRKKGNNDPQAERTEQELEDELLSEDESKKNKTGLAGGTASAGDGE